VDFFGLHVSNFSGLSAASIMNPALGHQTNIISNLMAMVGIIILLDSDYLWILFDGIMKSFHLSASMDLLTSKMPSQLVKMVLESFVLGFRLATPFVIIGMVLQFGLGILNRLVPQLQVFFLSIPVQVGITLFLLWFLAPKLLNTLSNMYTSQLDRLLAF
jgi:flagellar biosynthetic protein FliR